MKSIFVAASLVPLLVAQAPTANRTHSSSSTKTIESFDYQIQWHLITAGNAHLEVASSQGGGHINLDVESAGAVSRLYKVLDHYRVQTDANTCPSTMLFDAQEGKRHVITRVSFDHVRRKLSYNSQDAVNNRTTQKELDIPPCAREILSGLMTLRGMTPEPGKTASITVTDGRKVVPARIEAQTKEKIEVAGHQYVATRYEAFVFDNVLYRRKGRAFLWISDDAERLPLQLRFQMGFPIGNVLVQLQKHTKV